METYVVNVEAAVHREGEYLLVERSAEEDHAPGLLSLVGGKVEGMTDEPDALERTVEREVREEVGVSVSDLAYVASTAFTTDGGEQVVNVVFRAEYESGEARVREPEEVASVHWKTPGEIADDDEVPAFTREYVEAADGRGRE